MLAASQCALTQNLFWLSLQTPPEMFVYLSFTFFATPFRKHFLARITVWFRSSAGDMFQQHVAQRIFEISSAICLQKGTNA